MVFQKKKRARNCSWRTCTKTASLSHVFSAVVQGIQLCMVFSCWHDRRFCVAGGRIWFHPGPTTGHSQGDMAASGSSVPARFEPGEPVCFCKTKAALCVGSLCSCCEKNKDRSLVKQTYKFIRIWTKEILFLHFFTHLTFHKCSTKNPLVSLWKSCRIGCSCWLLAWKWHTTCPHQNTSQENIRDAIGSCHVVAGVWRWSMTDRFSAVGGSTSRGTGPKLFSAFLIQVDGSGAGKGSGTLLCCTRFLLWSVLVETRCY